MMLKEWLRDASPKEREKVATEADTTVEYLYQIAGGHRNASASLAKRLEVALRRKVLRKNIRPDIFGDSP